MLCVPSKVAETKIHQAFRKNCNGRSRKFRIVWHNNRLKSSLDLILLYLNLIQFSKVTIEISEKNMYLAIAGFVQLSRPAGYQPTRKPVICLTDRGGGFNTRVKIRYEGRYQVKNLGVPSQLWIKTPRFPSLMFFKPVDFTFV